MTWLLQRVLPFRGIAPRCLRSVGLEIAPGQLREMAKAMDSYGDGLIPTAPVLEFLRQEAGTTSGNDLGGMEKVQLSCSQFCYDDWLDRSLSKSGYPGTVSVIRVRAILRSM